jgi:TldD protein
VFGNAIAAEELLDPLALSVKKALADTALDAAGKAGASYCDVRIGRYLNQYITTRDLNVESVTNTESTGVGVRVIAAGAYGFAATNALTPDAVAGAARQAVAIARANAKLQSQPVQLAPVKSLGEVAWATPIKRDWRTVPIKDKADMLIAANRAGLAAGASFMRANLFQVNQQKYFASTDGSYIDQDIHRLRAPINATAVDKAREKLTAQSVDPGKYDLVLAPENLFLTIHESVGHPTELDRVLGYEANFAGTSFCTLDKWESGKFNFGSKIVNFSARLLERVHGDLRPARLAHERLLRRRQGPAEPGQRRLARRRDGALQRHQRDQHGTQDRVTAWPRTISTSRG